MRLRYAKGAFVRIKEPVEGWSHPDSILALNKGRKAIVRGHKFGMYVVDVIDGPSFIVQEEFIESCWDPMVEGIGVVVASLTVLFAVWWYYATWGDR